ncbi:MAG: 3-methyl-2-oxobutanoate dehydrogenase subunit VorB [Oscillospiraceae bacterium]|jgi:2-oxoglutarate ferredoxin oxidoreductase subunit alpha|nr:3-methyl-2-oxobutanoate dehydrogenase subunit VorB [Oscillospiraceae bacterium]
MAKSLMKGNEALAEAAIRAGCKCFFGYPITPQTELSAYLSKRMKTAEGFTFLQAESEVAAINMVYGAAAAGVRVMTSSSSPGISLKSEGISYIAGADLPCVIINVQRGCPGLGGIQPSQADYWQATKGLGHGDFRLLVYAPSSVQEMVDTIGKAFDNAEKFRLPAMLLADGILGQMMEPVEFIDDLQNTEENVKEWATTGHKNQRKHNIVNSLYLQPNELEDSNRARWERYAQMEKELPEAESYLTEDADIVVVGYGSTARIAKSAVNKAREKGIKAGLFRPITLFPYPKELLIKASEKATSLLTVEMSMGQMVDDVRAAIEYKKPVHFYGRTGGIIPKPGEILSEIEKIAGGVK